MTRWHWNRRWLLAGFLILGGGFASSCVPPQAAAPTISPGGQLVVDNTTDEELDVFVDGNLIGRAPALRKARFDRLPLGKVRVLAEGRVTRAQFDMIVPLKSNEEGVWRVMTNYEQASALDRLPTGVLRVHNTTAEPVRVFIDQHPREMIWAGGETEYRGILMGVHRVLVTGIKTGFTADREVAVSKDAIPVFVVTRPEGAVRIENRSGVEIRLDAGGRSLHLRNGEMVLFPGLGEGSFAIMALDNIGRPVWSGNVAVVPNRVIEMFIPPPPGRLAVVSEVNDTLQILADGRGLGDCLAQGAAQFEGLAPGMTRLQAVARDGTVVARARLAVTGGDPTVWLVRAGETDETIVGEGTLLVTNHTREQVRLRVASWDRGEIPPGGRRSIAGLTPGAVSVATLGLNSRQIFRAEATIRVGETTTVAVRPALGTLAITNERDEEVMVLVDEEEVIRLAPSQKQELRIGVGRHRLESRGVQSLVSTQHEFEIPASAVITLRLTRPFAALALYNAASDAVSVKVGTRELGVLLPGDRATIRDIATGRQRVVATSTTRPLSWSSDQQMNAGELVEWTIGP